MADFKKIIVEGQEGPAARLGSTLHLAWRLQHKEEQSIREEQAGDQYLIKDDTNWWYHLIGHKKDSIIMIKVAENKNCNPNSDLNLMCLIVNVTDPPTDIKTA